VVLFAAAPQAADHIGPTKGLQRGFSLVSKNAVSSGGSKAYRETFGLPNQSSCRFQLATMCLGKRIVFLKQ
jgi:hypothetical protein